MISTLTKQGQNTRAPRAQSILPTQLPLPNTQGLRQPTSRQGQPASIPRPCDTSREPGFFLGNCQRTHTVPRIAAERRGMTMHWRGGSTTRGPRYLHASLLFRPCDWLPVSLNLFLAWSFRCADPICNCLVLSRTAWHLLELPSLFLGGGGGQTNPSPIARSPQVRIAQVRMCRGPSMA